MDWKNAQFTLYDPVALGNTTFVVNGPDYRIRGVELQLVARVTEGLTVQGSSAWNSSNQTSSPCLISNDPASPTLGKCITEVKGAPYENPFGAINTRPALSPAVEFNLRARYDWSFSDYKAFVMVGANHVGTMTNEPPSYAPGAIGVIPSSTHLLYVMPGYTTYDASCGVSKDNWTVQVYGQNLSNSDASTFTSAEQWITTETPLRPRVLGAKFGYKF